MRTLSSTLLNAQKASSIDVLYKVVLTKGATTYTYDRSRILPSEHDEEGYSQRARIVLNNSDGEFSAKNLKGYKAVLSYGAVTGAGNEYSACPPLWVVDQQFDSVPGRLICSLDLVGIPNLMDEDKASESYIPAETDTLTVKNLVEAICGATLTCFTGCTAYLVVWDTGYDTLADTYVPKDSFRIYTGGSRLAALRRVLDYTANVARFEDDGKIHILKPVTSGTTYDYEYNLSSGHTFWSKAYRQTLVFPNKVVVRSRTDDDPQYSGSAQVSDYADLPAEVKKTEYLELRLTSNTEANNIAAALIAKAETGTERGSAEVPLNVGAEVFDYVNVTDQRQTDSRTGNLGYIHRRFGGGKWKMTFGFGNWLEVLQYQNILKGLEKYTDAGNYYSYLYVKNLVAESLDFVWLDPDNNIDLSLIGDTLDHLADGEVYARIKTLHLDAYGGLKLDENVWYKLGYDPNTKRRTFTSTPTTPYDVGDLWLDASTVKRCTTARASGSYVASDWTATTLDAIADGSLYHRVKSASLTADGLVILDQVVVGTYGLTLATDISAGHIRLDSVVTGTYGLVLTTDISSGHIKGSAVVQTADYRLTTDTEKGTWNSKVKTFHQASAPTSGMTTGDLWFDTDDKNKVYRYSGTSWVEARDSDIALAIGDSAAALAAANAAEADAAEAMVLLTDIASDTKVTPVEKLKAKLEWDSIVAEAVDIVAKATAFGVSHADYDNAYGALYVYILTTQVFADMSETTTIVRTTWDTTWKTYFTEKVELCNALAAKAKEVGDTAIGKIADMGDDGKITPPEKLPAKAQWDEAVDENSGLVAAADVCGVSHTDYTNAYNALNTYLNTTLQVFADMDATTTVVRTTWDIKWRSYWTEKVALMSALSVTGYGLAGDAYDLGVAVDYDIVHGYLTLSEYTDISGEWYLTGGVLMDASKGIRIFGTDKAFSTYSSEANARAGTNPQCYMGTDGCIYGGAGKVLLGSVGLRVLDDALAFYRTSFSTPAGALGTNSSGFILQSYDRSMYISIPSGYLLYMSAPNFALGSSSLGLSALEYMTLPRKTSAPSSPSEGMMVFNSSTGYINVYRSGAWVHINYDTGWA